jgi:hypothetical protein
MKPLATPSQRMIEAGQRMLAYERKYRNDTGFPLVVDMVEFYPDRAKYLEDCKEFWYASREYLQTMFEREAA